MEPVSVYLHIPFCRQRCNYCDFNTYAEMGDKIPAYVRALGQEISLFADGTGNRLEVRSVYFGGGTPSLLEGEQVAEILGILREVFEVVVDAEVTLEANPGTVTESYFQELRESGVNRLSLGVQSAHEDELRMLERLHGYDEAVRAFNSARKAGFENISVDLMFGLPGQRLKGWVESVEQVLRLEPDHISLYGLTVERGTRLEELIHMGELAAPDSDDGADMYIWIIERLEEEGFVHYEISNWARRDGRGEVMHSRHNLQYWLNQPYIGFGAGAHGFVSGFRTENVLFPIDYIERLMGGEQDGFPRTPATSHAEKIDKELEMRETMMMGLRLIREGIPRKRFFARFGVDMGDMFGEEIRGLEKLGLIGWSGEGDEERLGLTRRGILLGNQVFMAFV